MILNVAVSSSMAQEIRGLLLLRRLRAHHALALLPLWRLLHELPMCSLLEATDEALPCSFCQRPSRAHPGDLLRQRFVAVSVKYRCRLRFRLTVWCTFSFLGIIDDTLDLSLHPIERIFASSRATFGGLCDSNATTVAEAENLLVPLGESRLVDSAIDLGVEVLRVGILRHQLRHLDSSNEIFVGLSHDVVVLRLRDCVS